MCTRSLSWRKLPDTGQAPAANPCVTVCAWRTPPLVQVESLLAIAPSQWRCGVMLYLSMGKPTPQSEMEEASTPPGTPPGTPPPKVRRPYLYWWAHREELTHPRSAEQWRLWTEEVLALPRPQDCEEWEVLGAILKNLLRSGAPFAGRRPIAVVRPTRRG